MQHKITLLIIISLTFIFTGEITLAAPIGSQCEFLVSFDGKNYLGAGNGFVTAKLNAVYEDSSIAEVEKRVNSKEEDIVLMNKNANLTNNRFFIATNHQRFDQTKKAKVPIKFMKVECRNKSETMTLPIVRDETLSRIPDLGGLNCTRFVCPGTDLSVFKIDMDSLTEAQKEQLKNIQGYDPRGKLTDYEQDKDQVVYIGNGPDSTSEVDLDNPCIITSIGEGAINLDCDHSPAKIISGTPLFRGNGKGGLYFNRYGIPVVIGVLKTTVLNEDKKERAFVQFETVRLNSEYVKSERAKLAKKNRILPQAEELHASAQ